MVQSTQRRHGERGFALAMVVFLLFAVTVMGMTGYQLASIESDLAVGNESVEEALLVARAGLARYVGEQLGVPDDETYGAVGDGSVTITPRKVAEISDSTDLYLLTAVGTVSDVRHPTSPSTRTARQYAYLNKRPVKPRAAFMTVQSSVDARNPNGEANGTAQFAVNAVGDCPAGDNANVGNIHSVGGSGSGGGGSPAGPNAVNPPGSAAEYSQIGANAGAVVTAAGLRWSVLKDATFSIPHTRPTYAWPSFGSLPADSFPVVRYIGDYTLDTCVGKGVLIVTGTFTTAGNNCTWKGIILAGAATSTSFTSGSGNGVIVEGLTVSGLNGGTFAGDQDLERFHARWYPCYVRRANRALAYLMPLTHSAWEF